MRPAKLASLAAVVLCAAAAGPCATDDDGGGTATPDGGVTATGPATALFELKRAAPTSEFYALPFPNDLRRHDDGSLDLDDHPRPNVLIDKWYDTFAAETRGFGTNSAIYVRFSGAIDTASLPQTPSASL